MSERNIIEIAGDDREQFLQGITTNDVSKLADIQFSALLSPQGKILHDFFLIKKDNAIWLDVHSSGKELLLKRLAMYKLRAKVTLRDASEIEVGYSTKEGLADPRHAELPKRIYGSKGDMSSEAYHTERYALGIPDITDIAEDTLLDAGYDLLSAVSFTKGCFVGQEVTARMHYKNIARRGFYKVTSKVDLPAAGVPVTANGVTLGTLRGNQRTVGLAMLKFEEMAKLTENKPLATVDNQPVEIGSLAWLAPKLALFHAEREKQ